MNRETHQPVIIPDAQMRSFILVAGTYDEAVIYVEPEELKLVKGTKVRITGGVLKEPWANLSVCATTAVWW